MSEPHNLQVNPEDSQHPLILEFVDKIALEAEQIARKNAAWTTEGVLAMAGFQMPGITPRIRKANVTGWQLALREEKKNAPADALVGGKDLSGAYAQFVSTVYKNPEKKQEYDERARIMSANTSTTIESEDKTLGKLLRAVTRSIDYVARQKVNIIFMACPTSKGVKAQTRVTYGHAESFVALMTSAGYGEDNFRSFCNGGEMLEKLKSLQTQTPDRRSLRRTEVRDLLLSCINAASKTGVSELQKLPRGQGKFMEMLTIRKIAMKTPSAEEGWPDEPAKIEQKLISTRNCDVEAVIEALQRRSLSFHSSV